MGSHPPKTPGPSAPGSPFEKLNNQILSLPLWVKQVLYSVLKQELENILSKRTLDTFQPEDTLQIWHPELTLAGKRALETSSGDLTPDVIKLLRMASQGKAIIDVALLSRWTLEQCCIHLLSAISKELILAPKSGIIQATILYLSGRVRLGEYLVKIGRVTVEQLDQALRTQRYIEDSLGERTGIANVLINLGYINKMDSEGILFLKEESRKTYSANDLFGSLGGSSATPAPNGVDQNAYNQMRGQLQQSAQRIQQLEAMLQQKQNPQ